MAIKTLPDTSTSPSTMIIIAKINEIIERTNDMYSDLCKHEPDRSEWYTQPPSYRCKECGYIYCDRSITPTEEEIKENRGKAEYWDNRPKPNVKTTNTQDEWEVKHWLQDLYVSRDEEQEPTQEQIDEYRRTHCGITPQQLPDTHRMPTATWSRVEQEPNKVELVPLDCRKAINDIVAFIPTKKCGKVDIPTYRWFVKRILSKYWVPTQKKFTPFFVGVVDRSSEVEDIMEDCTYPCVIMAGNQSKENLEYASDRLSKE